MMVPNDRQMMIVVIDIIWPISQSHFYVSCLCSLKMKFIHYYSYVKFTMKSMSICNDSPNYDEIIIQ